MSYRPEHNGESHHVAVMNTAHDIDNIRVALLYENLDVELISELETIIQYYLYKLNPDASIEKKLSYICYTTSTISNFMGSLIWGYVPSITSSNLMYYFECRSKLVGIYGDYYQEHMQNLYLQEITEILTEKAADKSALNPTEYNDSLIKLYNLIYDTMPYNDNFTIKPKDRHTLVEFAAWLADISIDSFNIIVKYLEHIVVINNVDIQPMFRFYYTNHQLHQKNQK